MPKALPEHVLPLELARKGELLEGSVPLEPMARLATLLHDSAGSARFALRFGYDDEGQARVLGRIEAQPVMLCQRCLEPMRIELECEVSLALVPEGTDTATLDPGYEPLVVGEAPQRLSELIEDEIILALPNFARHRQG
ncbi:MAG: YceD family protein, partial [Gammaproteobacteria bacterium]|nr:YceD family protein [Gammaproteobacteria bacterium]